jgi:putative transposase
MGNLFDAPMHDARPAEEPVLERGLLTVPDEVWQVAVRRAEVIGPLAAASSVGAGAVDAAATELGVSRRQVYLLLGRWRAGEGVISDLIPGRSSGGRGREQLPDDVEAVIRDVLRTQYLTRQKKTTTAVHREIARVCRTRGLAVPSRGTITRRIARLDPVKTRTAREGRDAARALRSAGGVVPPITRVLQRCRSITPWST